MIFENMKKRVQAIFDENGVPDNAVPGMKRRGNFHSALAQAVVESDPDPCKRWSVIIAGWIVGGHVQSIDEHRNEILKFMAQRRAAKSIPRGSKDYAKACWLRTIDFKHFDKPNKICETLDIYAIEKRGKCELPIEHITPCGLIVYRADEKTKVENDPAAKMARWCVLSSYWGGYGGPPYYPVEKDGSWVGIIVPNRIRRNGIEQALRNGGNSGMMGIDIIIALAPFIMSRAAKDDLESALKDWLELPKTQTFNTSDLVRLCVAFGIITNGAADLVMFWDGTAKFFDGAADADLESIATTIPSLLPDRTLVRLMELGTELKPKTAKRILSSNIGSKEQRSKVALNMLISTREESYIRHIMPEHGHIVLQENPSWGAEMFIKRAKRVVKFATYYRAVEADVTDDELLSGVMYYGTIALGMVCLHLPFQKTLDAVLWKGDEPFCILVPLNFRVNVAMATGCIKPVRTIAPGMQQADDDTVRRILAMDGLPEPYLSLERDRRMVKPK